MTGTPTLDMTAVIHTELIAIDIAATTKQAAIREITHLLATAGYVNDEEAFAADVSARELEGPTGLGQGVAIPHGKSPAVNKTTLAVATVATPLAWESLDDEPISIIILFAVRDDDAETLHIKLLQKVAVLLAHDDFIASLHSARTAEEIAHLFTQSA